MICHSDEALLLIAKLLKVLHKKSSLIELFVETHRNFYKVTESLAQKVKLD